MYYGDQRSFVASARGVIGGLALLGLSSTSLAGVVDSPPPVLTTGNPAAKVMFVVPGVVRHSNLRTEFLCTSLDTRPFKFAVEVFPSSVSGSPPINPVNNVNAPTSNGTETLNPGETRTIATGGTAGVHEDSTIEPACVGGPTPGGSCNPNVGCPGTPPTLPGTCGNGTCSNSPTTSCTLDTQCPGGTCDFICTGGNNPGASCDPNQNCGTGGLCQVTDIANGSARIVSESKKIACSAFITDRVNNPPTGMVSLKVIQKSQKGD